MATNKNAFLRYKTLDNCFRNTGKRYFIADLIDACNSVLNERHPNSGGISRRQIFDDIEFMESSQGWSIDLVRDKVGRKVYYRYRNRSFSINNMPLNEIEMEQLESAIEIIGEFSGILQFSWLQDVIPKLRSGMANNTGSKVQPISFESNPYLKGVDFLGQIHCAIHYKKVLSVIYKPYMREEYTMILHPYFLKQYNNRWFLLGLNPEIGRSDWNIAIDRIKSISETDLDYTENTTIEWSEYFEDIIGVTKPYQKEPEKIEILFFENTGYYIETKPIHGSQKSNWIDKHTLLVTLELVVNYEFEKELLSYGDQLKIISPNYLAEKITSRLDIALKRYGKKTS